jgi:hypothetical protein
MSYYRQMQTTQERRAYIGIQTEEFDVKIKLRQSRSFHRLPNAWNDLYFRPMRSWKEHRKLQYHYKD